MSSYFGLFYLHFPRLGLALFPAYISWILWMVSLLWMVFATARCSVSSANLMTIHYSSKSWRDGVKWDPEVQLCWLLLALSKSFAQWFFWNNSSGQANVHHSLCWVCRLLYLPVLFCTRDRNRVYLDLSSGFVVLSCTENQCLVCFTRHWGSGFFSALCVSGLIGSSLCRPGDCVCVDMLFLLSLQLFLQGLCLICIFLFKNSDFSLLSHLYFWAIINFLSLLVY